MSDGKKVEGAYHTEKLVDKSLVVRVCPTKGFASACGSAGGDGSPSSRNDGED